MRTKKNLYRVSEKDSIEEAINKNESLLRKMDKMEREIRKLKSQNSTLKNAWSITKEYLVNISNEKSLNEIFDEMETSTGLTKVKTKCPNCKKTGMKKQQYSGFGVISCGKCNYRNKVNEKGSSAPEDS